MTGPEHYREAQNLLERANEWLDADEGWRSRLTSEERLERRDSDTAQAQVHATLALAASHAANARRHDPEWQAAIGREAVAMLP